MNRPPIEEFINTQLGGQTEQIKDLKKYSKEMYNLQQQMINAAKNNTVVSPDITNRLTELTDKFKQITTAINDSKFRLADLAIDASNAFTNIAQSMKDVNVGEIKDSFTDLHSKIQELSQMQFELNNDNVSEYTNKVSEVINGLSTMKQFVTDLNQQGLNLNFDASAVISQLDDLKSHYTDVSDSAVDFAKRLSEIAESTESITAAFNKTSLAFDSVKKSADDVSSGAKTTKKTLTELFAALDGNTNAQNSMNDMSKQIDELKKSISDLQAETANPQNLMGDATKATVLTQQVSAQMAGVQQLFEELMNHSGDLSLRATENLSQNIQKLMDSASDSISGTVSMITTINDQLPQDLINKLNEAKQSSSISSTDILMSTIKANTDRITGAASSTDMSYLAQTAHTSYANAAGGIGNAAANAYQSSQMLLDMSSGFNFLNNRAFKNIATESTALARTGNEYKKAQSSFNEAFSRYENASTPQEKEQAKKAVDDATKRLMQVQKVMNEQAKKIGKSFKTFTPDDLARLGKEGEQLTKFVKDVLERTSKSAGDLHTLSKTLNLDVDEKTLKSLVEDKKAMNEFGEEIQKTEKKANDLAKTLKDGVGGALGSMRSLISKVGGVLSKIGLGVGALGPAAVGYKAYEMHVEQGRTRYKTMGVDASIGVTDMATSAANAQQRLMQGNDIYAMSGGMINREFLNESYKSAMQNVGGHYGSSPEQAMSEVNELVGKTALMQQVYGIDQGTMNDMYQTYFKDMKMSANDAAGAIAQVTETARTAGIPVSKYLKMINGLAQNFMKIGIEGDAANTVMGNVMARGARADVAQEVSSEAGNALGKMAGDKNWVAYTSSVMGMNPFEGLARAAYTHEANGDPRAGWANDIIKMADMRVNTMAGAAGNDPNVKRMIVTDTFKEMGFSQRSASMLTSSYMQGNTEQFKDLFEKESKKLDNPNAALEEVNKKLTEQLEAMTGQLAGSDKLRAQLEAALYANADKIGNVVDDLLKQFGPLLLKLQEIFLNVAQFIVEGIKTLVDKVSGWYNGLKEGSLEKKVVDGIINFAKDNPVTTAIGGAIGGAAILGLGKFGLNKLGGLAKKGFNNVANKAVGTAKSSARATGRAAMSRKGRGALGLLLAAGSLYAGNSLLNPNTAEAATPGSEGSSSSNIVGNIMGAAAIGSLYSAFRGKDIKEPTKKPKERSSTTSRIRQEISRSVENAVTKGNRDLKKITNTSAKQIGELKKQLSALQMELRSGFNKTSIESVKNANQVKKSVDRHAKKQQKMQERLQRRVEAEGKASQARDKLGREKTIEASNVSTKNQKGLSTQAAKNTKGIFGKFGTLTQVISSLFGTTVKGLLNTLKGWFEKIPGVGTISKLLGGAVEGSKGLLKKLPGIGTILSLGSDALGHAWDGDFVLGDIMASLIDNAIPTATAALGGIAGGIVTGGFGGEFVGAALGYDIGQEMNDWESIKWVRNKAKELTNSDEKSLAKARAEKAKENAEKVKEESGESSEEYKKAMQNFEDAKAEEAEEAEIAGISSDSGEDPTKAILDQQDKEYQDNLDEDDNDSYFDKAYKELERIGQGIDKNQKIGMTHTVEAVSETEDEPKESNEKDKPILDKTSNLISTAKEETENYRSFGITNGNLSKFIEDKSKKSDNKDESILEQASKWISTSKKEIENYKPFGITGGNLSKSTKDEAKKSNDKDESILGQASKWISTSKKEIENYKPFGITGGNLSKSTKDEAKKSNDKDESILGQASKWISTSKKEIENYGPFGITSGNLSKSTEDEAKESNEKNTANEKADDSRKKAADSSAKKIVTQAQKEEELSKVRNKSLVEFMKLEQELIGNFQASVSIEHGNLWKKSHEIEEVLKLINHNIIESGKAVASISSGGSSASGTYTNAQKKGEDALKEFEQKHPEYAKFMKEEAQRQGVPAWLEALFLKTESGFNQGAVSKRGAIGLGQLMPKTAAWLGVDPNDPYDNMRGSIKYVKMLIDRYKGDLHKAVAAYNSGQGTIDDLIKQYGDDWYKHLYKETSDYLVKFGLATGSGNNLQLVMPDAAGGSGGAGPIRWQSQFENTNASNWCTTASYGMLYNSLHGTDYDVKYIHDNIWNGNSHSVYNILDELGLKGTTYSGSKERTIAGLQDSLQKGTPTYLYFDSGKPNKFTPSGQHAIIITPNGKGGFSYNNPNENAASGKQGNISLQELSGMMGAGDVVLVPEQFNSKYQGSGINSASQLDFQEADTVKPPTYESSTPYSIKGQGIGNDLINNVISAIDTTKSQEEQINQAVTASNGQIKAEDLKKEVESSGKTVQDAVKSLQNKYRPPAQTSTYTNDVTAGISGDAWLQTKLIHMGQIYGDYSTDVHRGMLGSSEGLMGLMDSMYQAPVSQHVGQWQKAMQMVRGVTMGSGSHRSARQRLDLSNAKGLYRMSAEETGETWRLQGTNKKSLEAQVEKIKTAEEKAKETINKATSEKTKETTSKTAEEKIKETTSKATFEKATSTEETAAKITAEEKKQETAAKAIAESKDAGKVNTEEMRRQAEKDLENKKIDVDVIINGQLDNFIAEFERKITPFIEGLGAKIKKLDGHARASSANGIKTAKVITKALNSVPKE